MGCNRLSQMVLSALVCQGTATLIGVSTTDYTITACKRFDLQHLSGIVVHVYYSPLRRCARHAGRDADPADAGGLCEHVRVGAGRESGLQMSVSTASAPRDQGLYLTLDPDGNYTD
ncbi:hypothetical protein NHJ13734_003282 [Beauveria thailandica]